MQDKRSGLEAKANSKTFLRVIVEFGAAEWIQCSSRSRVGIGVKVRCLLSSGYKERLVQVLLKAGLIVLI